MKRVIVFLFVIVGLAMSLAARVYAAESITSFTSDIVVNRNTSLSIKETIAFETDVEKHGIYRYIPFRYTSASGLSYRAQIYDVNVTGEDGAPLQFEQSLENGNLTLKIGDPDLTFTGLKTYVISYQVENAVQDKDGVQSLVWDITGEGWQIPILSTRARISTPWAEVGTTSCYSGLFGENNGLCRVASQLVNGAEITYSEVISYGDNMTVDMVFKQPNQLIFPSAWQRFVKGIWNNSGIALVALPGIGMFWWWWKAGRDQVFISPNVFNLDPSQPHVKASLIGGRQTPFVYEPLKDLSPGEAGVMLDERADNQDVIAEIIDLARKKYLKITTVETKKLFGKDIDYLFTQLKSSDSKLHSAQSYLQDALFAGRKSVKVSELKGTFYQEMAKVKELLYTSVTTKGGFVQNPNQRRLVAIGIAIAANVVAFIVLIQNVEMGIIWVVPVFLVGGVLSLICAWSMVAKTAVGSNLSWQAKGLKETIRRGAWREKIKEKHLFIEEVLPFAVSLGVVNQLSRDMEKLNIKPPSYVSSGMAHHMAMSSFMNSFSSSAASGLSYNPSSSSSGGGGSGGGGGGGGGGSW